VTSSCLPAAWATDKQLQQAFADAPRMGASPDGLLTHRVTLTEAELRAAAAALRSSSSSSGSNSSSGSSGSSSGSGSSGTQAAVQALLRVALGRIVIAAGAAASGGVPLADDGDDDDDKQCDPGASTTTSSTSSTTTTSTSSSSSSGAKDMNDMDGSCRQLSADSGTATSSAPGLAFPPSEQQLLQLLLPRQEERGGKAEAEAHGGSTGAGEGACTLIVREVVEVKNHCPFGFRCVCLYA
jgi:hypothetical protein